jgi:hypothetical protein
MLELERPLRRRPRGVTAGGMVKLPVLAFPQVLVWTRVQGTTGRVDAGVVDAAVGDAAVDDPGEPVRESGRRGTCTGRIRSGVAVVVARMAAKTCSL